MKRLLREPLLHFLLLGALLFVGYAAATKGGAPTSGRAVSVTPGQVATLVAVFERTWQRAPTADERAALIETFVRDEVLYREGVALGLDRDDAVIRRRVRQKVELLADEAQAPGTVRDAELQGYLDANRARFEVEPRLSFRHVYLDPGRAGRSLDREVARLLVALRRDGAGATWRDAGDPTQLAVELEAARLSDVARDFGAEFASALLQQAPGEWHGPMRSAFGVHVVLVSERIPARTPPLAEVRAAVEREWARERQVSASEALYQKLRARYTVSVEPGRQRAGPSP